MNEEKTSIPADMPWELPIPCDLGSEDVFIDENWREKLHMSRLEKDFPRTDGAAIPPP